MTAPLDEPPPPQPAAPRRWYPSPADWRDELLYSVLLDRFAHARFRRALGDPGDGDSRHGGYNGQPFTAPAVKPPTMYRWRN